MQKVITRLLAMSLGTAGALGIALLVKPLLIREGRPALVLHDTRKNHAELEKYLVGRGRKALGATRGPLGHQLLTRPVAKEVFNITAGRLTYDPLTYFRPKPFLNNWVEWDEHPDGGFSMSTNSLGLREDGELSPTRPLLRVFVTGDSHTDGVCGNAECFPNVLEASLIADRPSASVEILNAGCGTYSFYNYVGVFERYIEFGMDIFVVAVYGGNDFHGVIAPYKIFCGEKLPRWHDAWSGVEAATKIRKVSLAQYFIAYAFFAEHPELEELAVDVAVRASFEIQRRCAEEGVELIIAYIPPEHDVRSQHHEAWPALREALQLDDEQLQVTHRQADRFLAALKQSGVRTVDLRPAFDAHEGPLYWRRDCHLNLAGNRLVAEELKPHVVKAWAVKSSPGRRGKGGK